MKTCACGFEFNPDRPIARPVSVICPQCGAKHTLEPPAEAPPKKGKGAQAPVSEPTVPKGDDV